MPFRVTSDKQVFSSFICKLNNAIRPEIYNTMNIEYEHREALQHLVTDYWTIWVHSEQEELPDWFYIVLDFMEVVCHQHFSVVTGFWEEY